MLAQSASGEAEEEEVPSSARHKKLVRWLHKEQIFLASKEAVSFT